MYYMYQGGLIIAPYIASILKHCWTRMRVQMLDEGYLNIFYIAMTLHILLTTATFLLFQYILLQPLVPLTGGKTIPYHSFHGNVTFKDVNFTYPTRPNQQILKNFSLSLPAGRMVALCGMSGGGNYHTSHISCNLVMFTSNLTLSWCVCPLTLSLVNRYLQT